MLCLLAVVLQTAIFKLYQIRTNEKSNRIFCIAVKYCLSEQL